MRELYGFDGWVFTGWKKKYFDLYVNEIEQLCRPVVTGQYPIVHPLKHRIKISRNPQQKTVEIRDEIIVDKSDAESTPHWFTVQRMLTDYYGYNRVGQRKIRYSPFEVIAVYEDEGD